METMTPATTEGSTTETRRRPKHRRLRSPKLNFQRKIFPRSNAQGKIFAVQKYTLAVDGNLTTVVHGASEVARL